MRIRSILREEMCPGRAHAPERRCGPGHDSVASRKLGSANAGSFDGGKRSTSKPSLMISPHRERDEPSYAASVERVISKEEMPEVTRFFGIVVRMYFNDHSPAHFHAEYGEYEALFEIETLSVLRGYLPRRAMALVLEWAVLHRQALRADWERARSGTPLESIAPLE